jgi:RHS repeat-associated protein
MDLGRAYDNRLRITNNIVYSSSTPLPSAKVTLACITSGCPSFSGSVSVTVGGVPTPFVTGSTLSALASNLVSAINSTDGMTATATSAPSGTKYVVTLTSLIYGADGEASLSASVSSGATFTATTSSAKLTGDKDTIAYSYTLAYAPNGNVSTVSDTINGNWTYAYDTLNRLTRAQATTAGVVTPSGTFKTQCWTYDSFGNRTGEGEVVAKTTCPSPLSKAPRSSWSTYAASNRVTQTTAPGVTATYVYDDAGNVLNDGVNQYVYDFEGRICAVRNVANGSVMTQYVYDAEGRRVAKGTISTWPAAGQTCAAPTAANGFSLAGTGAALYLRGLHGDQDTELDGTGHWRHTNVFAAGGLTVTYDAGATPSTAPTFNFNFADWLGTKRLQASNAAVTLNSWASDPFGSYLVPQSTGTDATEHHFTGKERDTESGNDYFGARYYSSQMGRFMSPDWALKATPVPYAELGDPQSLDLYECVRNNPLSHTDVDGHWDPSEHVLISRLGYTKAGMAPNEGVISGIRDVDGANHNVYSAWLLHFKAFRHEQYAAGTQAHHFLRDASQTQRQAYDAGMNQLNSYARAGRAALISGDQAVANDALKGAGHLIEDSFAHTTREDGTGAITHIQCFNCKGEADDHQHPPFYVYDATGSYDSRELSPEAQGSVDAWADYLKLMGGAKDMSTQDFDKALSSYEGKYLPQKLPDK